jgi:hypothetical protein
VWIGELNLWIPKDYIQLMCGMLPSENTGYYIGEPPYNPIIKALELLKKNLLNGSYANEINIAMNNRVTLEQIKKEKLELERLKKVFEDNICKQYRELEQEKQKIEKYKLLYKKIKTEQLKLDKQRKELEDIMVADFEPSD